MVKTFKKIIFPAIFLSIVFSSCEKTKVPEKPLHTSTLEYFEYEDGTWWEYELESNTSITQKFTVENKFKTFTDPDIKNTEVMQYEMTTDQELNRLEFRAESESIDLIDRINIISFLPNQTAFGPVFFNFGFKFERWQEADSIDVLSNYTIGSTDYTDVIKTVIDDHPTFKRVFFAKDIGIIRKEYKDGRIYNLKNYQIIR